MGLDEKSLKNTVLNDALCIVIECLRSTLTDYLHTLSDIQPSELRRLGATLFLANRGSMDPVHVLPILSGSSDACQDRLRSRRLFVIAVRNLSNNLAGLGISTT